MLRRPPSARITVSRIRCPAAPSSALEQVRHIATSPTPQETYANYAILTNDQDESICFAIIPTGLVKSVTPLCIIVQSG
jgi:hypothetical protein